VIGSWLVIVPPLRVMLAALVVMTLPPLMASVADV
jgi:hypothetical protein